MTEFNQVFDGDLAERVFIIGSIVCVALFAGVLFLKHPFEVRPNWTAAKGRMATMALFLAVAIPAAVGIIGLLHAQSNASNSAWSLSIDEISKTVDMQALPVQLVDNAI